MPSVMQRESKPQSAITGDAQIAHQYERLLLAAQHAQAAADASVAELASLRRRLAEAPHVLQQRTDELTRARLALEQAENNIAEAREQMSSKQAAAAQLIETAAEAQRGLARALMNQEAADPEAIEALSRRILEETSPARPVSLPAAYNRSMSDAPRAWTPPPSMEALNAQVAEYMAERDALCPSCGTDLRGLKKARCPDCQLHLSVDVLKSVAPLWFQASTTIWIIRLLALITLSLTTLLSIYTITGRLLPGCGVGSQCDFAFSSPWAKLVGVPVALLAMPLFLGIFAATFRLNLANGDSTRRRAWTWISGLSFIAAGAGVWFIVIQVVFLHAICPYCMAVNVQYI